ncbi:MAG: DUF4124 domain-containing protein [Chromatiales bacterium]
MNKGLLILGALLVFPPLSHAAVYKWTDADGGVHYADQPVEGAERVKLPEPSRYSPPPRPPLASGASSERTEAEQPHAGAYGTFRISRPDAGEYVRNATGDVEVEMVLEPGLQEGHLIRIRVDGVAARQDLTSTHMMLKNLVRGPHTLAAEVLDGSGTVVATAPPVGFFLFVETVSEPEGEEPPADGGGRPTAYPPIPRREDQFSSPEEGRGQSPAYAPVFQPIPSRAGGAFSPLGPGGSAYRPSYQPAN